MDDNSIMPFGKHKGKHLSQVPASYLLYIYDNYNLQRDLKAYIEENMDVLLKEVK